MRVKIKDTWHIVEAWQKENVVTANGQSFPYSEVVDTVTEKEYQKRNKKAEVK